MMRRPLASLPWAAALPGRIGNGVEVVAHALRRFWDDNGFQAAASLTYTTLLALVPLLTVVFAIFSAFPAYDRLKLEARGVIFDNLAPSISDQVQQYVDQFVGNAGSLTGFGIIGLAITSILLFSSVEGVVNAVWRATEPRPIVTRLLAFWALLTVTPLLLGTSLSVSSAVLATVRETGAEAVAWISLVLPFVFEAIAFTLIYLTLPNRSVLPRDAITGGVVAALLMEGSKWGFGLYIASANYQTIYGAVATIPIFLLWLYIVWSVFIFGAQLAATIPEWRAGKLTKVGPEGLLTAQRVVVALAILRELSRGAALGVGLRQGTLSNRIPVGAVVIDGMLDQLEAAHWVARTNRGAWVITRDMHTVTLHDLRSALGMGLRGNLLAVGDLDAGWQRRVADLFLRSEAADRDILGVCLADLFCTPDEPVAGEAPVPPMRATLVRPSPAASG